MAKTYWIGAHRAVTNPDKLAAYAQFAGPAIVAGGGKFIVRGTPASPRPPPRTTAPPTKQPSPRLVRSRT
jgi:hypothetical protein